MAKILIVDDIASNREFLVTLLGYGNHELTESSDGVQALDQARAGHPDLIIADLVMPSMDGFEFVRRLRSDPAISGTQVIFYSATYREHEARRLARECGVEHILNKPAEPGVILQTVNEALGLPAPVPLPPSLEEFDREHLRLLADKLSQKIYELEAVSLQLQRLVEIGQQLASEHDTGRLLEAACTAARELVGAQFAVLGMVDEEKVELKEYTVRGLDPTVIARMSLPEPRQGVIYSVLSQRQAVRARNPDGKPESLGLPADHPPIYSFLIVPVASSSSVYGWLGLRNKFGAEEFSSDDERIATSLAAQTAVAYENCLRLAEIERHASALEQRVEERTSSLQATNSQLSRAEEIGRLGNWEWLIAENRVIWSDGLYKVFGLLPDEFGATYEAYLEQVHPEDLEYVRNAVNAAFLAGGMFEFESRIVRQDGVTRHLFTRGEMKLTDQGLPERMMGSAIDITERKQAEEARRIENERFMRFVDANLVGIVIADASGRVNLANNYYLNVLGVTREDFLAGKVDWRKFTPPEWLLADEKALAELSARGVCEPYEKEYVRADGSRVSVYIADAMLPGPDEQIAAFVLDITDRKQMEKDLQHTAEELRRSNSELEQFAYVASHDLQEPLRKVIGFTNLLAKRYHSELDPEADEFIGFTVEAASRMQNLIQDLLAYSRVGSTDAKIEIQCDVILEQALSNLQVQIETSRATITRDPLPRLTGNEHELVQLFQNLIGNALKFHGERALQIHIGVQRDPEEWIFSVRDNGIGIDPQYKDRIFQVFQRLHRKDEYPGTGIGLAICKKVVEHHGGHTWFDSEPGKGTTFFFSLPTSRPTETGG